MLRRWFEDTSPFTGFAVGLFVLGSAFVLVDLQSPSLLQWTGTEVAAVQQGGIAFYSFKGSEYTLDVPDSAPGPSSVPTTVFVDPQDPSHADFSRPVSRWIEASAVLGPYTASVVVLAFGFARRSRRRRLRAAVR